ncbi:MAG: hypothetical protein WA003_04135 [Desulfuromonadaceae bacterium]
MNLELVKEWLPPVIYKPLLSLASEIIFMAYPHKEILKRNLQLKGIGKGKRAFLLATGPSINQENLRLLAGEDCFSISNFYLHSEIQVINPLFHGFAPYHEPLILENYVEWLRQADRALPPYTKIVLGHRTLDIVKNFDLFPNRDVHYVYLRPHLGVKHANLMQPIPAPRTGPLLLLPLMIYMGYEQIYLLGCDNTTLRDYKKTITNFYSPDQDIRNNATDANTWSEIICEHEAIVNIFKQYQEYAELAKSMERMAIINLSTDSWIDSFPFARLEELPGLAGNIHTRAMAKI